MRYLIVIPARGGSKGIPGKNIVLINGKPLLKYTLDLLKQENINNADVAVSTDSEEIKKVSREYAFVTTIDRPKEISGDHASTEDALLHALGEMEAKYGKKYNAVITLQATSPLRIGSTLRNIIAEYESTYPDYDAILSVNEDRSDFWRMDSDGHIVRLNENAPRRRQDRQPLYIENSAYYITDVEALQKTHSILGTHVRGYVISCVEAVDINEPIDLVFVEALLQKGVGYGK